MHRDPRNVIPAKIHRALGPHCRVPPKNTIVLIAEHCLSGHRPSICRFAASDASRLILACGSTSRMGFRTKVMRRLKTTGFRRTTITTRMADFRDVGPVQTSGWHLVPATGDRNPISPVSVTLRCPFRHQNLIVSIGQIAGH